jgi:predicted RNase H-like HicB family nuclease
MSETSDVLTQPYARIVTPDADGYRAVIRELACVGFGKTAAEAFADVEAMALEVAAILQSKGVELPKPGMYVTYEEGFHAIFEQAISLAKKGEETKDAVGIGVVILYSDDSNDFVHGGVEGVDMPFFAKAMFQLASKYGNEKIFGSKNE